jgi:hypothetical protein
LERERSTSSREWRIEVEESLIIPIGYYNFDGPYPTLSKIENRPGLYAIISEYYDKHYLLDVGQSDDVKKAIKNHERRKCWEKYRKGRIRYAVYYTPEAGPKKRTSIENEIRKIYETIPCGGCPLG